MSLTTDKAVVSGGGLRLFNRMLSRLAVRPFQTDIVEVPPSAIGRRLIRSGACFCFVPPIRLARQNRTVA